jgi:N-acetylglucosamine kinase-like BadF-type ATPase
VQASVDEGDPVAREIRRDAAGELALAARSVAEKLEMRGAQFPLVLSGGAVSRGDVAAGRSDEPRRRSRAARAARLLDVEPAMGAVRLAVAEAVAGADSHVV